MAAVLPAVDQQFDREPAAKEQTRSNMEYTLAKPTAEEYHAVAALKGAAFAEKNFCCGSVVGKQVLSYARKRSQNGSHPTQLN